MTPSTVSRNKPWRLFPNRVLGTMAAEPLHGQSERVECSLPAAESHAGRGAVIAALIRRPELVLWAALLAIFNWPILSGGMAERFIFMPSAVQDGEWWRVLTHPFVHVTWYHLLLDAAAFLMLVQSLIEKRLFRRISYVAASAAGGLLAAWWAAPGVEAGGMCGLSGVAHGLTAVSALELMRGQPWRSASARCGGIMFCLVAGKATAEALTGQMFFAFLHFGLMGDPVGVSHAGGIVGALACFFAFYGCSTSTR